MNIVFVDEAGESLCSAEVDSVPRAEDIVTIADNTEEPRRFVVERALWRIQGEKVRAVFVTLREVKP